jgi:hypothetical protein
MTWEVHYFDHRTRLNKKSRVFLSKESALRHACDLEQGKFRVLYVEGPKNERIMPSAILAWCKGHKTRLTPLND